MKKLCRALSATGGLLALLGSHISIALADNLVNPLGSTTSFSDVLGAIGSFLLAIAVPLCGIMVVVGGFQMLTSAGDPTKFSNGKKTLIYAAVGFVVVLLASSVVPVIKSILGGS